MRIGIGLRRLSRRLIDEALRCTLSINPLRTEPPASAFDFDVTLASKASAIGLHLLFAVGLLWYQADYNPAVLGDLTPSAYRSAGDTLIGVFLSLIPAFWLPARLERPSQIFGYLLYLTVYISFCTVGFQSVTVPIGQLLPFVAVCCVSCIALFRMSSTPPEPVVRREYSLRTIILITIGLSIVLIGAATVVFGVDYRPLAIENVYDVREIRRDQFAATGNWYWGYLLPPLALVLAPFLVCLSLPKRRPELFVIGMLMAYAAYQITSGKDALGGSLIAVIAFYAWRAPGTRMFSFSPFRIISSFLIILLVSAVYDQVTEDPARLVSQLTIGRIVIVPGMLTAFWVEFFSINPFGLYAGSGLLGAIFGREQVYGLPLSYVIGLQYFNNEQTNANVNLWADGYGQWGVLGALFATAFAMLVLRILDRLSIGRDLSIVLPLCLPLAFALTNGSATSVFLTNGIWVLLLIVYVLPQEQAPGLGASPTQLGMAEPDETGAPESRRLG
ncbi:MAG TPA: hypothetical protein VKY24_02130 [Reyranella sp.]|nr:hypothetical protein [Reyranella sp.]